MYTCILLLGKLLAFWVVTPTGIRPVKWPQQSFWNVIFSVMSVCQQGSREGVPCDHYPWCIGHHCTGPPSRLGISLYRKTPPPLLRDMGPHCTTPTHIEIWWSTMETFSPTVRGTTSTGIFWLLKHILLVTARYASYWNAFLLNTIYLTITISETIEAIG